MSRLKLEGELSLDGSGWETTLKKAGASADRLADVSLAGLKKTIGAVFAVGLIGEFVKSTVEYAAQIKDFSEQTGLATDEVQRLAYAAKSVGLEFSDFQTALSKLGAARKDAAEKNDDLLRTFERYGVELKDLQNPSLRNIDLLQKMAAAIKDLTLNSGDRQSLRELFGKGGDKLAEVLGNLDNFKSQSLISKEDIEQIDKLDKAIERLKTQGKVALSGPVSALSKVLTGETLGERFQGAAGLLGEQSVGDKIKDIFDKEMGIPAEPSARATGEMFGPNLPTGNGSDLFVDQRKAELLEKQAQLNELAEKNAFNLLGADEKRVVLQKEINRLLADANTLRSANPLAATNALIEREKLIGQMQGLPHSARPTDSLLQVGGVLGDTASAVPQIHQQLIDVQQKSIAAMDDLTTALRVVGAAIGQVGGANPFSFLGIR